MPLTPFQRGVLRLLASFRTPESYIAGATVINQSPDTPRFSDDLDIFHDAEDAVTRCAEIDAKALTGNGYAVEWLLRRPGFHRAIVRQEDDAVRLDWAVDSAFRFFPIQPDEEMGFRLHYADVAMNKVLALAGRSEPRDFVDTLHLHRTYLSLGAICWAACAKDPGFTPEFLLQELARNAKFRPEEFEPMAFAAPLDLKAAKREWIAAQSQARSLFALLPASDVGCLYLDRKGNPVTPTDRAQASSLTERRGTLGGVWPAIES